MQPRRRIEQQPDGKLTVRLFSSVTHQRKESQPCWWIWAAFAAVITRNVKLLCSSQRHFAMSSY